MAKYPLLTQLAVDKAKARPGRRYELPDGPGGVPGFALRVSGHGAKTFALRYRVNGRMRRLTLGRHPVASLGEAREAAREALRLVERGVDPASARLEERRERERNSVTAVAADYVERHLKRNTKRWRDAGQMLARDVLPHWGERPIQGITRRDVLDLVDGVLDRGSPVSANRVLSLVKRFLFWAVERGIVDASPAAGVKPPHRERPRDRTLDEDELRALWRAWDRMVYPFGDLAKLLLLTAQRRGEVAAMRWDQLDLDKALWRLPAASTKARREHLLPLPPAAVAILHAIPRIGDSPLVFPSTRAASANPVSGFSKALRTAHRLSETAGWHWHDLRRSAATGMARLNVPPHVCERILNHTAGRMVSQVARVYNVHSYQAEMRAALDRWAAEVERVVNGEPANVVVLRA
jgi:integrase